MANVATYVKESYTELVERVTWPSFAELQESSILVFVASLMIAGIVFVMDYTMGVNSPDSTWRGLIGMIYAYLF